MDLNFFLLEGTHAFWVAFGSECLFAPPTYVYDVSCTKHHLFSVEMRSEYSLKHDYLIIMPKALAGRPPLLNTIGSSTYMNY